MRRGIFGKFTVVLIFLASQLFNSCRKETQLKEMPAEEQLSNRYNATFLIHITNPYSLSNIRIAADSLNNSNPSLYNYTTFPDKKQYIYCKFNPQTVTKEIFQALEADSTIQLLDFPFGEGAIFDRNYQLDSAKAEALKDGNIYAMIPKKNSLVTTLLNNASLLSTQVLDTLFLPDSKDTALQKEALVQSGFATRDEVNGLFGICLFKRPSGYVRYWDNQLNQLEPVRNTQVWGLVFGIPFSAYTDGNGYYSFPWAFSIGTIMGTKSKNYRVNIKPLDTHGTLVQNIPTLITQFIVGSISIRGWVSSCDMRYPVNFDYYGHTQVRYWCQLMNAVYFHDLYCTQEGIQKAPNALTIYAQWANTKNIVDYQGVPDFGGASTPLLGHINITAAFIEGFINKIFDGNVNLATTYPNLFNLLTGLLPDMTFRIPQAREPQFYNSRLTQEAFHELSHASQYLQVGSQWWIDLIWAELNNHSVPGNPYGDGTYSYPDVGNVSVSESWAEFLGTNFALRRYPAAIGIMKATNTIGNIYASYYYRMDNLIENEFWFYGSQWIPMGLYHDLMDNTNIAPNNPLETWDKIQGATISQMYYAFAPSTDNWCAYFSRFAQNNNQFNPFDVDEIFGHHNVACLVNKK